MHGLPDKQFLELYAHWESDVVNTIGKKYELICSQYPDWENFILNGGIFRLDAILARQRDIKQYFTTFTLQPGESKEKLKHLVTEIFPFRPTLKIFDFHFVEEHIDTNYHIHTIYRSEKSVPKSRLKNYEKYGFIDHQKCKSWEEAYTYINKENPSTHISEKR